MSIRRYLVLTLVAVLTLITFIAAIQGYKASMTRAERLFEQQLIDFALIVKGLHQRFDNIKNELVATNPQTNFAFQVWAGESLVFKSDNSPTKPIMFLTNKSMHFGDVNFSGQRWRAISLPSTSHVLIDDKAKQIVIIVAQPLEKQFLMAQEVILAAVMPMIIAIILLSFLIYGIITQGLKPLHKLTKALATKQSNDFTPLDLQTDNSELSSVVTTLNHLFLRLSLAFERERHFAADAAHELKTPLSVLKINVHNLSQGLSDIGLHTEDLHNEGNTFLPIEQQGMQQSKGRSINYLVKSLTTSVDRMGHVIDQLLHLNRTNPEQVSLNPHKVKLKPLLQMVIADLYQDLVNKKQTITLMCDDLILVGDQLSLQLMLTNLLSNANKYTPFEGEIKVSVKSILYDGSRVKPLKNKQAIIITVEDSGKGIAEEEYARVFDRFYRVGGDQHESNVLGCGLGLTIVKHIVDIHRGYILLSSSNKLGGLKVDVFFETSVESLGKIEKTTHCSFHQESNQSNTSKTSQFAIPSKNELKGKEYHD